MVRSIIAFSAYVYLLNHVSAALAGTYAFVNPAVAVFLGALLVHERLTVPVVLGGAVKGNSIYGTMPTLALSGPDDTGSNGRWIPSTSVDQFGATLARWFGVADQQLNPIFPNLAKFTTRNLGFLG